MSRDEEERFCQIRVTGYPSLAAFIANDPDHSTAVYQRFDELSARNLLYLQSELAELKAQQEELDRADYTGDQDDKKIARDWKSFRKHADDGDAEGQKRVHLVHKIRSKLKEYSTSAQEASNVT